ncbi:helix-turn-helix domain-containing protein [Fulvivirga sp. 29W222]|uniref:Helix-turn-helix domain-containing protein n=1 Tax=Fulvivirga marina TaxID=2494733 RepID=A0A937KBY8_9BACT|nr:helix-turn-helix domain-containing protein [Fulvivirga marina]MBL6446749.1 helix-turn-helix domain-containing protein [Fulvivirga marina]
MNKVNKFYLRLREIRERKGLNQEHLAAELSKRTGISFTRNQISQYENGRNQPKLELLPVFMDILGVSAEALLGLPEHESKNDIVQLDITTSTGIRRKDVNSLSKPELKQALTEVYDLADKLIEENMRLKDIVLKINMSIK